MKYGLVSIIMPCYNGEKYISESIRSVQKQNFSNWELLVIDDGSTDHSPEIIQQFEKADSRIVCIQQKNAGSAAARNAGIRRARGKYLAFLDADDLWLPYFLAEQIYFMKENMAFAACSSYQCINEESREIYPPVICMEEIREKDMQRRNLIGCLTGIYDCSVYGKIYFREELGSMRDDYAFWLDVIRKTGKIYGNRKVLARYRIHPASVTAGKKKLLRIQYGFYRNYLGQNLVQCLFHLGCWGIHGIWKYQGRNPQENILQEKL